MRMEPGRGFRWGIVTRRSLLNRDGTEGSTRRQERAVHSYIKDHDMGVVVAVYTDIASAYDEGAKRPEFENALADLRAGRIDGIAVWKIDRLVRRATQFRRVVDVLEESGGRLFSLVESIDTGAEGSTKHFTNLILTTLVSLAEMESDNTAVRTTLMHQDRARQGLVHRTQVRPYGHTADWTEIVPGEAELIREAARRIVAGEPGFSVTQDWTRRKIPTAQGKTQWRQDVLRNILLSPRMIAKRDYRGDLIALADVPLILDEKTWERVRAALSARSFQRGRTESRLLTNIMVCVRCGEPVVGGNVRGTGRPTYNCRKRPNHQDACGGVQVVGEFADALVGQEVAAFLSYPNRIHALLRQHAQGPELDALHDRINELSESLLALDTALNPPPGKPRMTLEAYWQQVAAIEAEREQVQRRLSVTREAALLTETLNLEWTPERWADRPMEWKRAILRLVVERIELAPGDRNSQRGRFGNTFDPDRIKVKFAA
jgi:site-specific DNA recombinase